MTAVQSHQSYWWTVVVVVIVVVLHILVVVQPREVHSNNSLNLCNNIFGSNLGGKHYCFMQDNCTTFGILHFTFHNLVVDI